MTGNSSIYDIVFTLTFTFLEYVEPTILQEKCNSYKVMHHALLVKVYNSAKKRQISTVIDFTRKFVL